MKKVVVVGGGPAGMMTAIRAGQLKQRVLLVERNASLGKKLLLTGKGRCNLTNLCDLDLFIKRFSKNGKFLRDAFKIFFNHDLMDFFNKNGLKLKIERQSRVFPVTDSSNSVLKVLIKELKKNKVEIICNSQVENIVLKGDRIEKLLLRGKTPISCHAVVLATGGVSYASTGSTGDGLRIAEKLGHRVVKPSPGLVPLVTKEKYAKLLEGLTLKNIRLLFSDGKKKIISEIGELLFTDFGISGPLVLTLSGQVVDLLKAGRKVYVEVDLKPALSKEEIDARLLREIKIAPKKTIKNVLKSFLPVRLINVFLDISNICSDKISSYITHGERKRLVHVFKTMRFTILKSRPINMAMITRGGISLKDVNPRTMESRRLKGLYFSGEILDVDADTGGFNLQAAFSTGYLAGQSLAE